MNMGVGSELLAPGVQNTEEADLGAEVSGIASDFQKCFRTDAKQKIVEDLLVLQDQWSQPLGQGEDHMDVAGWEEFSLTRLDPTVAGSGLTLRAVPISARVVGDGAMPAASALIEMTAQCGGTTAPNGPEHFEVLPTEPAAISFEESSSRGADEIGHLQGRPAHLVLLR